MVGGGLAHEGSGTLAWSRLGTLQWIEPPTLERRPLAAGSGLVCTPGNLWVMADDLHHLVRFPRQGELVGQGFRVFAGELPSNVKARKRIKPDTESLIQLQSGPEGLLLLAFPSGSKPNRTRASEIRVDAADNFVGWREIGFSLLFNFLQQRIPDLNIEGGVIADGRVLLLQRGNGKAGFNAIVEFDLDVLMKLLHSQFERETFKPRIIETELPKMGGVSLTFTDACSDNGRVYFAAAAERGASTYDDGEVIGSAIGRIDSDPVILAEIDKVKVEGLAVAKSEARALTFLAVTDADDPHIASELMDVRVLDG